MKKFIFAIILFVSLFFSGLSVSANNTECNSDSKNIASSSINPIEEWREYILAGDQWFLIIHYNDGSIGIWPVGVPPLY
ncbi:MAG TPA: hypothetical protein VIK14_01445 [Ignavibacteria bacterium]